MKLAYFYDSVEKLAADPGGADAGSRWRLDLANRVVRTLLEEYERLQEYEAEYSPTFEDEKDDARSLEVLRSVWQMFDAWAREAEPIYHSVVRLPGAPADLPELDGLRDRIGFARARLAGTPESHLKAVQQLRRGEGMRTTVEELRNELRARRGA